MRFHHSSFIIRHSIFFKKDTANALQFRSFVLHTKKAGR
jgi:hypothetical protein